VTTQEPSTRKVMRKSTRSPNDAKEATTRSRAVPLCAQRPLCPRERDRTRRCRRQPWAAVPSVLAVAAYVAAPVCHPKRPQPASCRERRQPKTMKGGIVALALRDPQHPWLLDQLRGRRHQCRRRSAIQIGTAEQSASRTGVGTGDHLVYQTARIPSRPSATTHQATY